MKRSHRSIIAQGARAPAQAKLTECSACFVSGERGKPRPSNPTRLTNLFCTQCMLAKSPAAPPPYH